jgi:hypothetical protein
LVIFLLGSSEGKKVRGRREKEKRKERRRRRE